VRRVIIADDQSEVRSALRLLLEERPGVSIVGEACTSSDLLKQVRINRPDLLLLDWELPGFKPGELMPALQKINPQLEVIAFSSRPQVRQTVLDSGACEFVCKSDSPELLLGVLDRYLHR
jgi:two-component system invasion response regulator UvrY